MTQLLKGKYALDRCIGRGGMAEVFAGRTVGAAGFSQRVAIKRIHPVHSLDAAFRAMFIDEAQLSSHLRHSNIVRVFDFDEDETGCLFLVMELVDGVDLDGLMGTGLLPLPVILFVTSEILRGLAYVHELPVVDSGPRGLVHRDVSPQNVLLSWDGAVQVSDFGIAKARTATQAGASVTIKGKPAYMSPEQAAGLSLDGRSDVFAVGIMLWEMLCGEPLFHDPDDLRATLAAVMFGDAPPPSSRSRRPVPEDLERATMGMLRRDRAERCDAAAALAAVAACADYPRSGREALAALLSERLPERAPRRGDARPSRPVPPWERVTVRRPAEPAPCATPTAAPCDRRPATPRRDPGAVRERARRRGLRRAVLGAIAVGAVVGVLLHVGVRGSPSTARGAPSPAAPRRDAGEHARPLEVPRAEPAPRSEPGPKLLETPASAEPTRGGDAIRTARKARAPAAAPLQPPAKGRMGIIDLRPETPAPDGAQRGALEIDLGR